jgi:hypothetical protein
MLSGSKVSFNGLLIGIGFIDRVLEPEKVEARSMEKPNEAAVFTGSNL